MNFTPRITQKEKETLDEILVMLIDNEEDLMTTFNESIILNMIEVLEDIAEWDIEDDD